MTNESRREILVTGDINSRNFSGYGFVELTPEEDAGQLGETLKDREAGTVVVVSEEVTNSTTHHL